MSHPLCPPEKQVRAFAHALAATFNDSAALVKYLACCQKYPAPVIYKAYGVAQATPAEKIKKSRAALFFYLIKKYAHHTNYHSRR